MKTSLIGLPFLFTLGGLTALALLTGWRLRRHRCLRFVAFALALGLALLSAAATVNAYYDYYPSLGTLLGQRARDQASARQISVQARQASMRRLVPITLRRGMVEKATIPGVASGFRARPAQVYLPPAWFSSRRPTLPVIELLHGTPGTPEDWTRAGAADVALDRWAATHGGAAPIVVMPDVNGSFSADTECVDGTQGAAETYLTVDVPRWVIAHLDAAPGRAAWLVAGSSEGGYCALDLALRHPDRYASFADFSGLDRPTYHAGALSLLHGSAAQLGLHTPRRFLLTHRLPPGMAGWFEVGDADGGVTRAVKGMAALVRVHGVAARLVVVPNAHHTWRVWRHSLLDAVPWMAARLGLAPVHT